MKVIFLCAGYGTRLEQDLKESGEFTECIGRPKALLPIGDRALISFWFDQLNEIAAKVKEIVIVTNDKFYEQFCKSKKWYTEKCSLDLKMLKIVNNGSTSNDNRLGAVADIKFALEQLEQNDDPALVIAGDTLFKKDFSLLKFVDQFERNVKNLPQANVSQIIECTCPEGEVHKHGIIEVDEKSRKVTSFLEKPNPQDTKSRSQCPCFYLIDHKCQNLISQFLDETKNLPLAARDATGNFLAFLIPKAEVFAFQTEGRYDVGNLKSYKDCLQDLDSH